MTTVTVSLAERSYPIEIDSGILATSTRLAEFIRGKRVVIVSNETVAPLYLQTLQKSLSVFEVSSVILPDGEQYKTLAILEQLLTELLQQNHGRDTTLIALGGGVIGDMCGFAAAIYQRGVNFIQVPTTLLAQVDSSVGGKTAVNHPLGKNMIGAFYQPSIVLIDTQTLTTLPAREFSAGLAEVIKYGIIVDGEFFNWLEANIDALMARDEQALRYAIARCCEIKADVVAADEREQGQRALLNLGHTFGHAIEAEMGYGVWLHGEAVAAGMLMAAYTAQTLGQLSQNDTQRIAELLRRCELPIHVPETMDSSAFLRHMKRDKKVLDGKIRLVLPLSIGSSQVQDNVSDTQLIDIIAQYKLSY